MSRHHIYTSSFKDFKKDNPSNNERVDQIHQLMTQYERIYVISVMSMKSEYLSEIRCWFASSLLCMAKRRIIEHVLSTGDGVSVRPNLRDMNDYLTPNTSIFMTNEPHERVMLFLKSMTRPDFSQTGDIAPETLTVSVGPLPQFRFNTGGCLHALGLPVQFEDGFVTNIRDYNICTAEHPITKNEMRLLKRFGVRMGTFDARLFAMWESGEVRTLME
jgi:mRNA turnover protein 4